MSNEMFGDIFGTSKEVSDSTVHTCELNLGVADIFRCWRGTLGIGILFIFLFAYEIAH